MERAGADVELVVGVVDAPFPPPPVPRRAIARIAGATSTAETTQSTTLWRAEFIG
jgi:hypothetical protein